MNEKKKEFLWGLRKETNFSQQQEMLHVDAEKKKMDERAEKVSEIISREHMHYSITIPCKHSWTTHKQVKSSQAND